MANSYTRSGRGQELCLSTIESMSEDDSVNSKENLRWNNFQGSLSFEEDENAGSENPKENSIPRGVRDEKMSSMGTML